MRRLLLACLALSAAAPGARAQGLGDPLLSATITQSVAADTNFGLDDPGPGTSYYADTRLLLGFLNETPTQSFALGLDTGLRALWEAEQDFDFTFASPSTATLDYGNEWASGAADVFLNYRQVDLNTTSLIDLDDDAAVEDIREIEGDATERRYNGGVSLDLATNSRSSYELDFEGTRFDYSGDDDGGRTPRTTLEGEALWLLVLNPVLTGTLGVGYSDFDADSDRETQIRQGQVEAGVIYDRSEALQLRFAAGFATYEREQRAPVATPQGQPQQFGPLETVDDESGYVLSGGLRYLFEEATVNAELRLSDAAPETRLSGVVRASYPLPRGELTGRVFQRYGGGNSGQEIRVTGAGIGLVHEINTISQLAFDVTLARQEQLDTDQSDTDRVNFTATYSRALTEVVSANVGYRFRSRDEDPESATSNAVFVELGRSFVTRP